MSLYKKLSCVSQRALFNNSRVTHDFAEFIDLVARKRWYQCVHCGIKR